MNTINVKLLNQVACAILDEPRKFDMGNWVEKNQTSPCGSTACIAGHAIAIHHHFKKLKPLHEMYSIGDTAQSLLKLDWPARYRLFNVDKWPDDFRKAYHATTDPFLLAEISFWRIQWFIATNGNK